MIDAVKVSPSSMQVVIARLICGVFLHVILTSEVKQGLAIMKFSNNHWWLFDSWSAAFIIGFTQMLIVILLEVVNIIVLATN